MTLLTPASDARAADWIVAGIRGFAESVVSLVPTGFETYLRLFHPAYLGRDDERRAVTWAEIAAAKDQALSPETTFEDLLGFFSYSYPPQPGVFDEQPEVGSLPMELLEPLVTVLSRHTTAEERCWLAVWHGFGGLRDDIRRAATFELPAREFHLLSGPLRAAVETTVDGRAQSANLWWPEDHAWCVATEIDFDTTYVGCSDACGEEILALQGIEVAATDPANKWRSEGRPS